MADPGNDPPHAADTPLSTAQFQGELEALKEEIRAQVKGLTPPPGNNVPNPPSRMQTFQQFFSSGVFFILLGLILLGVAYIALDKGVHTSFSFVLVVLGVAILLFGTGTQGIGKLESNTAAAQYNIAIAGGAGALAIAIGFGMVRFGPEMQQAFGLETRYVAAELRPHLDSNSSFAGYWAQFEIDGVPIPSVQRGGAAFVAYVPYVETQRDAVKHVWYKLLPKDPTILDPNLQPVVTNIFDVPLREVDRNNSGSDFPIYDKIPPVDMRSQPGFNALLQRGASQSLPIAEGASPPNPTAPAVVGGH